MSLHNQPKADFRENMEALPRSSRGEGDKKNSHVDHTSIYDRPGSTYEFQKFAFRGHKKRFEDSVKAEKCDVCAQMITSGFMITAEPFHYHEACCKCGKCGVELNGEYYKRGEKLLCQKCYEPPCNLCKETIRAGQGFVRYADLWAHRKCFKCFKCQSRLAVDKFYLVDGQPACEEHGAYLDDSE